MSRAPTDRELGIRAQRPVPKDRLGLSGPNAAHAERYEASPPGVLAEMLLGLDLAPEQTTFVDLGCGKGRVLCHAALLPFAKVVGVELSPSLCRDARDNLAALPAPLRKAAHVEVLHQDAARYTFGPGPLVVYLYNPFQPPVLRVVLRNLVSRERSAGTPTWVLYYEPKHPQVFEGQARLRRLEGTEQWTVYSVETPE